MNPIKRQAVKDVVKMLAIAVAVSALVNLILYTVPLTILGPTAAVAFLVYMIYIFYSIRVSQLESQEQLRAMRESK